MNTCIMLEIFEIRRLALST